MTVIDIDSVEYARLQDDGHSDALFALEEARADNPRRMAAIVVIGRYTRVLYAVVNTTEQVHS